MCNVDKMLRLRHWFFAVTPFFKPEVKNFISHFYPLVLLRFLSFKLVGVFIETSRKFHFLCALGFKKDENFYGSLNGT